MLREFKAFTNFRKHEKTSLKILNGWGGLLVGKVNMAAETVKIQVNLKFRVTNIETYTLHSLVNLYK